MPPLLALVPATLSLPVARQAIRDRLAHEGTQEAWSIWLADQRSCATSRDATRRPARRAPCPRPASPTQVGAANVPTSHELADQYGNRKERQPNSDQPSVSDNARNRHHALS